MKQVGSVFQVVVASDASSVCEAALRGDRQAWAELLDLHNHAVLMSLLAAGVRIDDAHDIAQETWAKLMERQRGGELSSLVLPGLAITQARFLRLDRYRRDIRNEARAQDLAEVSDKLVQPGAERSLISREQIERVRTVLAGSSPSQQRVFEMVYDEPGVPHAEVARRLGLSVQRVRQVLCEVRRKLRTALDEGT